VVLQNRGSDFTLRPGHPNEIAPRKRPYHTIIPAMAFRDGKPWLSFGVMGGLMQPQGHVQVLLNRLVFDMDVQQAGDAARFRHSAAGLALESGVAPAAVEELARRGHVIIEERGVYGGYQAVEIDWQTGMLLGGTESRKDGLALGY
jgi:gamma-glutamyltranspeptidase/glutathione hydrolase